MARYLRTSASLAATNQPFITTPNFLDEGVFVGYEMRTGRPSFVDWQLLRRRGIVTKPAIDLCSPIGGAKSSLNKSMAQKYLSLQGRIEDKEDESEDGKTLVDEETGKPLRPRILLNSNKHVEGEAEEARLARFLLGTVTRLADANAVNPYGGIGMTQLDFNRAAILLMTDAKRSPLDVDEVVATTVSMHAMLRSDLAVLASPRIHAAQLRRFSDGDVKAYHEALDDEIRQQFADESMLSGKIRSGIDSLLSLPSAALTRQDQMDTLAAAAGRCAGYLDIILTSGLYGGLFGGKARVDDLLTQDEVVVLDWVDVPEAAKQLMHARLFLSMQTGMRTGNHLLVPNYVSFEEQATELKSEPYAALIDETIRKSRTSPSFYGFLTQYILDYLTLGESGSRLRALGETIAKGFGARWIGRQNSDDATLHALTQLRISDADAWATTMLPAGCWAFHVPDQSLQFIQHVRVDSEYDLLETNQANLKQVDRRRRVSSFAHIQERINELGITRIGFPEKEK